MTDTSPTDGYVLGVDLGTTSTAAAINRGGHIMMLELSSLDPAVPSVLWLDVDGTFRIGPAAEGRAVVDPVGVAREFKRRFGDPLPLLLRGSPFAADDLMLRMLRFVVERASEAEGAAPESLVVCHPAEWGSYKQSLLSDSIANSSLPPARLLAEPEAAAIHYAVDEHLDVGSIVAVYDLGGGTFDVAFLRRTEGGWEFVGRPGGLERLGGVDFDTAVLGHVLSSLEIDFDDLDPDDVDIASAAAQLRRDCIEAKKALSSNTSADIPVFIPGHEGQVRITRTEFEDLIRPALRRSTDAFGEAIAEANLTEEEIDRVLLVGGSSRVPLVAQTIARATGRDVFVDVHPKFAVAMGAAASVERTTPIDQPDIESPTPASTTESGTSPAVLPAPGEEPSTLLATGIDVDVDVDETGSAQQSRRPQLLSRVLVLGVVITAAAAGLYALLNDDRGTADRSSGAVVGASSDADPAGTDSDGIASASAIGHDSPLRNERGEFANNEVYGALGPQSVPTRRWQSADASFAAPIVTDDTIYSMAGGSLTAIDVQEGRVVWSQQQDPQLSRMVLGSSSLYLPGFDDEGAWIDVHERVDGAHSRFDLKIGDWDREHRPVDLLIDQTGIYLLVSYGEHLPDSAPTVLIRLDPETGREVWRHERTGYGDLSPLVLVDGIIASVSDVDVIALDASTGAERWRSELAATPLSVMTAEPGSIVVQTLWTGESGTYVFEPATGELRWRQQTKGNNVVVQDGVAYTIGNGSKHVEARAMVDGTQLWSSELPDGFIEYGGSLVADDITLYVSNGEKVSGRPGIIALDRSDGSVVWNTELEGARWFLIGSPIAVAEGSLIVSDSVGVISAWS